MRARALMAARLMLTFLLMVASLIGCESAPPATNKYLLLHNGDFIEVAFPVQGEGSIRFLSLTETSRLDIDLPPQGKEVFLFERREGWRAYPRPVAGKVVRIMLREGGPSGQTALLPTDSDVEIRIIGGRIRETNHIDVAPNGPAKS